MDSSMEMKNTINVDIVEQQKPAKMNIHNENYSKNCKKKSNNNLTNGGMKAAKSPKMLFRCEICAADSIYHYYGVQSCEGCKQFFRRIIVKQKDLKCWKTQKCSIETGERCRSCRLDKCLLMGMDPKMVNIRKSVQLEKFIELLEQRRLCLIDEHRMGKLEQIRNEVNELNELKKTQTSSLSPKMQCQQQKPPVTTISSAQIASTNLMANSAAEIASACSSASILQPIPISATSVAFQHIPPISPMTMTTSPPSISFKMLDSLLIMENCLKKIWFSNMDLSNAFIERNPDLGIFLEDNKNLLNQSNGNFTSDKIHTNFNLDKTDDANGFNFAEQINSVEKDRFLYIEMAKTMPFFCKLQIEDQILLLRHIIGPVTMLFNAFYSFLMGADNWSQNNEFVNISMFGQSRLENDNKIMAISKQMLCNTMEAFKKANIGREEFVMLLAILFSSSMAPNLSPPARELLYDESVRHSKALLDLLQLKHGHVNGSQKYAIAIELLTQTFHFDYRMHLLSTSTRAIHAFDDATIFPKLFD